MVEITVNHLLFKFANGVGGAFYLKQRANMVLETTLEVALLDAAASAADIAEVAVGTGLENVNRCVDIEARAQLHEWLYGFGADVAIGFDFGETVAEIDLAIGTNRDATKAAVARDGVGRVALYEVGELCFGVDFALYFHDAVVEDAVLFFSVKGVAAL